MHTNLKPNLFSPIKKNRYALRDNLSGHIRKNSSGAENLTAFSKYVPRKIIHLQEQNNIFAEIVQLSWTWAFHNQKSSELTRNKYFKHIKPKKSPSRIDQIKPIFVNYIFQ